MGDGALQQVHQMRAIGMRLSAIALFIETADGQPDDGRFERHFVPPLRVEEERGIAFTRNLARHAREEIVDERAAERVDRILPRGAGGAAAPGSGTSTAI